MSISEHELTAERSLEVLAKSGNVFTKVFEHGSLVVEVYRPDSIDHQTPHTRDEVYVVISGFGWFVNGEIRHRFEPGQLIFVPAGVVHRFEDFTDDFSTWVLFYGPEGGEKSLDTK
jgi:mannose-6-phosphate isomerase-like protein (cupin superfamily)